MPNPDLLLGGCTSASAECRHWSGRASVGQVAQFCLARFEQAWPISSLSLTLGHCDPDEGDSDLALCSGREMTISR